MLAFPSWFSHFMLHRQETNKTLSWGLPQAFKSKLGGVPSAGQDAKCR